MFHLTSLTNMTTEFMDFKEVLGVMRGLMGHLVNATPLYSHYCNYHCTWPEEIRKEALLRLLDAGAIVLVPKSETNLVLELTEDPELLERFMAAGDFYIYKGPLFHEQLFIVTAMSQGFDPGDETNFTVLEKEARKFLKHRHDQWLKHKLPWQWLNGEE